MPLLEIPSVAGLDGKQILQCPQRNLSISAASDVQAHMKIPVFFRSPYFEAYK